jgi:hypothetical protein
LSICAGGVSDWSKEIALQKLDQIAIDTKPKAEVTTCRVKMHHALGRGKAFLSAVVAAVACMSEVGQLKTAVLFAPPEAQGQACRQVRH